MNYADNKAFGLVLIDWSNVSGIEDLEYLHYNDTAFLSTSSSLAQIHTYNNTIRRVIVRV